MALSGLRAIAVLFIVVGSASAAHAAGCDPVPPIQRDIETQKVYTDKHGSVRDRTIWNDNKVELANLSDFLTLIEREADAYAGHGDADARSCALQAIDTWAQQGALLGSMSHHGYMDRMWAAGSIGLTLIKLHNPALDPTARQWVDTVCSDALQATEEHTAGFGVNNLAYWGAMTVAACGIPLGRADTWQFAQGVFHEGLDNIRDDGTLERELGRRARATHYHEFGAQPLVVLARLSAWKGQPLNASDSARLGKLVDLVIATVNNPQLLAQAAGTEQKPIKMPAWLPLWNGAPSTADEQDFFYIKLGGDIRVLNAVLSQPH